MKNKLPVHLIFRESFEGLLAAIFVAVFLRVFVFSVLYIPSNTMSPGLVQGDFVLGSRLSYGVPIPLTDGVRLKESSPERGDVVSFRFPGDKEQLLVRRVIGLEGDRISIENGKVFLNGQPIEVPGETFKEALGKKEYSILMASGEKSQKGPEVRNLKLLTVPPGTVFVMSDNRAKGDDSRNWGVVPLSHIESRLTRVWFSAREEDNEFIVSWDRIFHKIH